MKINRSITVCLSAGLILTAVPAAWAGLYSGAQSDPTNPYDAGIPGFVDSGGSPVVNPVFIGWASGYQNYIPAPPADSGATPGQPGGGVDPQWQTPEKALGPVTGDTMDIVSLGDLHRNQIDAGVPPGEITLTFSRPIANGDGKDFAVFENGFLSQGDGKVFGELGYVEVSTNGTDFARFPCVSLTPGAVGPCGAIDPTDVYNLAGKHVNNDSSGGSGYEGCFGTPFDLDDLLDHQMVIGGQVELNNINYVRIVDVPGSGDFSDGATDLIDPSTGGNYAADHPVYDAWVTWGSGGLDLEAIGMINGAMMGDFDHDGDVNASDIDLLLAEVNAGTNAAAYDLTGDGDVDRCDADEMIRVILDTEYGDCTLDGRVNGADLSLMAANWLEAEGNGWASGDLTGDAAVNGADLSLMAKNWLFDRGAGGEAIPEPTAMVLLGLGLAVLVKRRRNPGRSL